MYDTVDGDTVADISNSIKVNGVPNPRSTITAAPAQQLGAIYEDDYAEVMTQTKIVNNTYQNCQEVTTKPRSQTLQCSTMQPEDLGTDDYSRLVHDTKLKPRLSVPLLSDYASIDLSDIKRPSSLGRVLDQENEEPTKKVERCDYETMDDPQTPPPLPTPVIDEDIIEIKFGSYDDDSDGDGDGDEEEEEEKEEEREEDKLSPTEDPLSKKLLHERAKGNYYETMADPPKADSPPPLPPPLLQGEDSQQKTPSVASAPDIVQDIELDELTNHYDSVETGEIVSIAAASAAGSVSTKEQVYVNGIASADAPEEGVVLYENLSKGEI